MMVAELLNIRHGKADVYIGRGSPFGNPYVLGVDGGRNEVVRLYRIYFYEKIMKDAKFRLDVEALRGKKLGCHCSPMACHGDVILEYLLQAPVV
jgi:hypothetical protein